MSASAKSGTPDLELHGAKTGNCLRAAIGLSEAGPLYKTRHVDLRRGEQRDAPHLALKKLGLKRSIEHIRFSRTPVISPASGEVVRNQSLEDRDRRRPICPSRTKHHATSVQRIITQRSDESCGLPEITDRAAHVGPIQP